VDRDDIDDGWMQKNYIFYGDYDEIFLLKDEYRGL
jgi:hypothetical protein